LTNEIVFEKKLIDSVTSSFEKGSIPLSAPSTKFVNAAKI